MVSLLGHLSSEEKGLSGYIKPHCVVWNLVSDIGLSVHETKLDQIQSAHGTFSSPIDPQQIDDVDSVSPLLKDSSPLTKGFSLKMQYYFFLSLLLQIIFYYK